MTQAAPTGGDIQKTLKPLLGVPDDLAIIDVMCFGPPLKPPTSAGRSGWTRS